MGVARVIRRSKVLEKWSLEKWGTTNLTYDILEK